MNEQNINGQNTNGQKATTQQMTFVAPMCTCCAEPKALLPRTDLPGQMAVCPQTGTLYRAEGQGYVQTGLPQMRGLYRPLPSVDLNQAGYA
jgi:hypothetical protein